METLNAAALTRLSVLPKGAKPRKASSQSTHPHFKNQAFLGFKNSLAVSRCFHGGLALMSSLLGSDIAKALTYEEALQQPLNSPVSDFDFTGVENFVTFAVENPIIVGGAVAVLAVPLLVSQLLGKPRNWGVESARNAYAKLTDDDNAQLLDIRTPGDLSESGSPELSGLKKKPIGIVYKGEDKPGFLKRLSLRFKEPENTTLFILDKFDGNSELVAELVTANGFKAAYAVRDGAEGSKGWKNSGLPWILPKKGLLNLDISGLTSSFRETGDAVPIALGVAAAAGIGLLAFSEVELVLQLLGSVALVQFMGKKFLFAEDRKQTIQEFEDFLNTKVAAKELAGDIQEIGKALLPSPIVGKALPAPSEDAPVSEYKSNSSPPPPEPAPEPILQVNSAPKKAVKEESFSSLSPYPNYPDFKPPTSPIPSQP